MSNRVSMAYSGCCISHTSPNFFTFSFSINEEFKTCFGGSLSNEDCS